MPSSERVAVTALNARMWRDFALLAIQSLFIGLAASVLLGLAVFAVA